MSDDDLDIDIEDFDEQMPQDGAEPAEMESEAEHALAPRGGGILLKIVILFVIIAAGGGVYITLFGPHGMLHHRVVGHPLVPQRMAHKSAPLPPPPAVMKKTASASSARTSLPVVGDKPPSAALLKPAPASSAGIPALPTSASSTPAAMPKTSSSTSSPVSSAPASPFTIPSPQSQKAVAASGKREKNTLSMQAPPMGMPEPEKPEIKGRKTMPAVGVPAVNKVKVAAQTEVKKKLIAPAPVPEVEKTSSASHASTALHASDSAEVQALKKKIALLEKTIKQLQQAPVVARSRHQKKTIHHTRRVKKKVVPHDHIARRHRSVHAPAWVLKAATPQAAWVARKGSSVLHKVKPGDSLAGLGEVEFIVHDSFGVWAVVGTKGRISQ